MVCFQFLLYSCQKMSLDALAKRILGVKLNKSKNIRCSNWEEEKLSAQQIEYAMNDAVIASQIFLTLVKKEAKQSLDSVDFSKRDFSKEMCDFRDVWDGDEVTNQSSVITSECHPDSNETCLTLEQSGENAELYLTGQEAAAGLNEDHDSPTSEFPENRSLSQEGNWEAEKLSTQEIEYAMNDALVANLIFLSEKKFRDVCNEDCTDGFGYYETTVNLSKFESEEMDGYLTADEVINLTSHPNFAQWADSVCQGLIDIPPKARKRKRGSNDKHSISYPEKLQMPSKNAPTRKSPLYKNCILTAPDGSRLSCLDRKKADWYINRGLGKVCLDCLFFFITFGW